jgi:lambda repressor-like predicted transcriptional regulator
MAKNTTRSDSTKAEFTRPFKSIARVDVPHGRNGKHKQIVSAILRDLGELKDESALRIPLKELGDSKENIRSAISRAARNANRVVATAADEQFLYIWNSR